MMLAQIKKDFGSIDLENREKKPGSGVSFTTRYALLGTLFGLLFPLIAMGAVFLVRGMPFNLSSIIEVQSTEPLLWIINTAPLFLGLFASFAGRREDQLRRAYTHLQQDERKLQQLTKQLQLRKEQLITSSEVSNRLSTVLNLEELLAETVHQIKEEFGYYHAQIYLLDQEDQKLVIAEGASGAGMELKARDHQIALDVSTSLIAQAARTGKIVQLDNVREDVDSPPSPLLPHTYAEMAVPITLAGQVIGVLDVQADENVGLDDGDAALLRSLTNQVAVAIRNARLFEEVETALAEAQATQERYAQQSWEKTKIAPAGGQYLYVDPNTTPPGKHEQEAIAEVGQKALAQNHAVVVASNESIEGESLVVPINLHNKTIGTLQLHTAGRGLIWDKDDLTLVQTIADQAAQVAENLRLFDETRQRAGREQTIRQITEHMRSATNLDELVKIAAEELGERFSVEYSLVELGIETASDDNDRSTLME